ncbi:hypothetical protein A2368_02230 [Candidatus Collierbacteria bacterium RIFOXYB1_FULL_49_13]|uniref:N-acetyltransferase domain-containing protein n=1 Tax=Candidatus Collierbacteria bacterium RIFOXYB1_FULL_49_13 TaxID=1817728 RepID=A0A1F5FIL6_9BACT|nr:MAG: hypothetical protein A2368_02230 [Candidatus Collierbacteria bacterium RIFOXYB1_FULL_49_13]
MNVNTVVWTGENLEGLAMEYAVRYWSGTWKELLVDNKGGQYGTYDEQGQVFPDTVKILEENGVRAEDDWPMMLWQMAGRGDLMMNGEPLSQYWTIESAAKVLREFVTGTDEGGYGGEILLLKADDGSILGFTAYTAPAGVELGLALTQRRFPYESPVNLAWLLADVFPGKKIGLFLDFAIAERVRGQGLGSKLFDARMVRLIELGAEVLVGRTIKTSPAQYYGNYIARGMKPILTAPEDTDKAVFSVSIDQIISRT